MQYRRAFLFLSFFAAIILFPASIVIGSELQAPKYPNLEPFTIESNEEGYYKENGGGLSPSFHFPSLKDIDAYTMHQYGPLTTTGGKFKISGETGPEGNISGSFSYSGYAERPWEDGQVDFYTIEATGQITNGKAAYDDKGYLRILGAAHYQRKFEFSGPVTLTLTYSARARDEEGEEYIASGTATAQAKIAFLSCISDEETINLCYIETGTGYGEYGFSANFVNKQADDFVWFNNLDFEFGLIEGIDFDPEAHHKLTQEPEEEQDEETPLLDESYLDEPQKAEDIFDNADAGFSINMYCDSDIYPEDGISCGLNIMGGTENQPYTVNWIMDGYVIKTSTVLLNADNFVFPNPPPGSHPIQVQVIDQATYNARVSAANVEVLVPVDDGKIKPWTQAMAGAGSVAILGAWLWAEWAAARAKSDWFNKWYEGALQKDRNEWYERQMAINDEKRGYQKQFQDYQDACEGEWKRFRKALLKTIDKYHKSDYLIDLYDDMHADVYRDGKWDGNALNRLEEMINTHLKMDRDLEAHAKWKRQMEFLNKRQQAFSDVTGSWTAMGVEVVAGILTGGASEMVFMPTRAIGNALYASERARLLGKTGWNAAKSVMVESGIRLGMDYIFAKAGEKVIGKAFEYGGKGIKGVLGKKGVKAVSEWWEQTAKKFSKSADMNLPVIKNNWGKGPKVFVNKPIYKAGPVPRVDFGMDNYLNNRIRPISSELADDMGNLFREGVDINTRMNNILKAGERYTITAGDEAAVRIMNNTAYKQAVRDGLVPSSVQQSVYQARDKICKNAMQEAFEQLDHYVIDGKAASSYIKSVAITGTGAKPLSPQAIGRFTDFDSTVIAGDTDAAMRAERLFTDTFNDYVQGAGINRNVAEVNMFSGIRSGDLGSNPGGYISDPLVHWQKVDMINRGRSALRSETTQSLIFNNHPDAAPLSGFGPADPVPHFPLNPAAAGADARGVIVYHATRAVRESGEQMTQSAILRQEGKHAMRVWKASNAGRGLEPPPWIQRLNELKTNPDIDLSSTEIASLWRNFSDYLDLPPDIGA